MQNINLKDIKVKIEPKRCAYLVIFKYGKYTHTVVLSNDHPENIRSAALDFINTISLYVGLDHIKVV